MLQFASYHFVKMFKIIAFTVRFHAYVFNEDTSCEFNLSKKKSEFRMLWMEVGSNLQNALSKMMIDEKLVCI